MKWEDIDINWEDLNITWGNNNITMANAIFITEKWLKENTPLPSNLDVKEIYPFYKLSQDKYVRDALGDNLYDALSAAVIADTLTNDQIHLLKLIRPSLAYYMIWDALPFLQNKIKNIGVVSTADDKQTNAARADFKDLRADMLNNAEYYMERVKKYLCNNTALFPEYTEYSNDVNANVDSNYRCDLFTDWFNEEDDNRIRYGWIKKFYGSGN